MSNHVKLTECHLLHRATGVYYLAHAYTNAPALNTQHAYEIWLTLFQNGVHCINPLAHTHELWKQQRLLNAEFEDYAELNHRLIAASIGVIVCMADGWERSRGIADEVWYAMKIDLPVFYLDCDA